MSPIHRQSLSIHLQSRSKSIPPTSVIRPISVRGTSGVCHTCYYLPCEFFAVVFRLLWLGSRYWWLGRPKTFPSAPVRTSHLVFPWVGCFEELRNVSDWEISLIPLFPRVIFIFLVFVRLPRFFPPFHSTFGRVLLLLPKVKWKKWEGR